MISSATDADWGGAYHPGSGPHYRGCAPAKQVWPQRFRRAFLQRPSTDRYSYSRRPTQGQRTEPGAPRNGP